MATVPHLQLYCGPKATKDVHSQYASDCNRSCGVHVLTNPTPEQQTEAMAQRCRPIMNQQLHKMHTIRKPSPQGSFCIDTCKNTNFLTAATSLVEFHDQFEHSHLLDSCSRFSRAIQCSILPQQHLQGPQKDVEVLPCQHEHRGISECCHCGCSGLPSQQSQLPKVHGGAQTHHLLQQLYVVRCLAARISCWTSTAGRLPRAEL